MLYNFTETQQSCFIYGLTPTNVADTINVPLSTWTHFMCVYDGSNIKIYRNGVETNSAPVTGTVTHSTNPFSIGRYGVTASYYDGLVDDARVYDRALTPSEISTLYRAGTVKMTGSTANSSTGLSTGLVGHWTFDGKDMIPNVRDKSGQGNHGSLILGASGNTATTTLQGKLGQAINFDGTNDYVGVSSQAPFIITGNVTLSSWVRLKSVPTSGAGIISFAISGETEDTNGLYRLQVLTTSGNDIQIGHEYGAAGSDELATIDTNLRLDEWYHITATRDDSLKQWKVYVNGVQAGATFTYTNSSTGGTSSFLGIGQYTSSSLYLPADMDDVRIYNRTLSASEVLGLYRLGTTRVTR
jgi:hypothetical protein